MYKLASATRHDRVVYDLMGPWYIEGTNWPDLHCEPRASLPSAVQAKATILRLCVGSCSDCVYAHAWSVVLPELALSCKAHTRCTLLRQGTLTYLLRAISMSTYPPPFRPFLAHLFPRFRRSLRLAPKIQEIGTKTGKTVRNGRQAGQNPQVDINVARSRYS